MGIQGLLPFLKKASRPVNVREFSGKVAAVDVYCWLHKGAFGCADRLVQGQKTDGYVVYVMRYVDLLLHHGVKPVLVFDGRNLPSKSATERKRRENREKYRKMARDFLAEGKNKEARECFQRCVDITPEMAGEVIQACYDRNVDCIVSPYEADSQLAYLNTVGGYVDVVISEDSDLALFGCHKIIFKLDSNGNGVLYERKNLHLCLGQRAENFTFEKFRYMGIMAGCDYLSSLHGIGIGKSCKFWSRVTNPDLKSVLTKIPSYLNMHHLRVDQEYIEGFIKANETFLYQIVVDPKTRKFRPLNQYPPEIKNFGSPGHFAGEIIEEDLQYDYAVGNLDIRSFSKVRYLNPSLPGIRGKSKYGKVVLNHKSVWEEDFNPIDGFLSESERMRQEKVEEVRLKSQEVKDKINSCFSKKKGVEVVKKKADPPPEVKEDDVVETYKETRKVFVSKYFNLRSRPEVRKQERKSRDWFDDLDEKSEVDPKTLIYNVVGVSPTKENVEATSNSAIAKPFKPPIIISKGESRNPFAKKNETPQKTPLSEPLRTSPLEVIATVKSGKEMDKRKFDDDDEKVLCSASKVRKQDRKSGDWFDDLDKKSEIDPKTLIYNVVGVSPTKETKEATSNSAIAKPFKPPTVVSKGESRNPFAKKTVTPEKPPSSEPLRTSPLEVIATVKSVIEDCDIEQPVAVIEKPFKSDLSRSSSPYFSNTPTVHRKGSRVSGLLKKPPKEKGQRSILQMFRKQ